MKTKSILAALLLMVAGVQTAWSQGFRVYQSDGTELQFSLKTDSIVFDNGLSGDEVFGPFTPVNMCIAKTWYTSKSATVTFNIDGTTDYFTDAKYEFLPYQGTLIIYNASGAPMSILKVLKVMKDKMIVSALGENEFRVWATTPLPQLVEEIVLSETSLSLGINDIYPLAATVLPEDAVNKELEWESSDPDVAEVSRKGKVYANANGRCVITCSAMDGSGVKAECVVTVGKDVNPGDHEYVDLGLPSGTLWSTCNVGASNPEEYGDYFAWGETVPKDEYNWDNYRWMTEGKDSYEYINKYTFEDGQSDGCWYDDNTFIGDNKTELDPEDDAATANWGAEWKMPSREQCYELVDGANTTAEWTTQGGVYGRKITSKSNGNSIFLPAAGVRNGTSLEGEGNTGHYWLRTLFASYSDYGFSMFVSTNNLGATGVGRYYGHTVRPVRAETGPKNVTSIVLNKESIALKPNDVTVLTATVLPGNADNKEVAWESSNESVAYVTNNGIVIAVATGSCTITCSATDGSGVKAECAVTVADVLVTSITLNKTSLELRPDGYDELIAFVLPANASNMNVRWSSSKSSIATVDQTGKVTAVAAGTCTITCAAVDGSEKQATCSVTVISTRGTTDGHEWVDLGLPSGTLWATCNVGANSPEGYGAYFAWGETTPKETYDLSTYKYCKGSNNTFTRYCRQSDYGYNGYVDGMEELLSADDAATANWGDYWQMPSQNQFYELQNSDYTNTMWKTRNGVPGMQVVSKINGNTIFLSAAGYYSGTSLYDVNNFGSYWTRSLSDSSGAVCYGFYNTGPRTGSRSRTHGVTIRPVRKK